MSARHWGYCTLPTAGWLSAALVCRRLWAAKGVPAALQQAQADLYGTSIKAGTAARPLMTYGQPNARLPAGLLTAASRAACTAISGERLPLH